MVRDRIAELHAAQMNNNKFGKGLIQDIHINISRNKKLQQVFDEVEEVRGLIQLIAENIYIAKDLHKDPLVQIDKDKKKELETRASTISQTLSRLHRKLGEMEKEVAIIDDSNLFNETDRPIHIRIKALQYATMLKSFSELIEDYSSSMLKYYDKCHSDLERKKKIVTYIPNEEQLDLEGLIDFEDVSVFTQNYLEESRNARQRLADTETRHNELIKLEKSIREILHMLIEIAIYIDIQGEQIKSVEYFAKRTASNVDGGRNDLKKAKEKSDKYRKRKYKCLIIIGIIIIVLLLVMIVTF
ncbi:syntaxin-1A-like isoform X1 [Hylaeus volcanicus]|uniref:syntaxin-1A-like isoform X1 n=2 Tax=Hylaeus volcanicus TaxID=313075 RepID=UPI0023B77ECA|nr:syntaxin-1A-like isoform X1 [Hylaeus volcanicus]